MENLADVVARLPELYQQVYGHPDLAIHSSRAGAVREEAILGIIAQYQQHTGRKDIRVLDIGCAQGYFCFKAAELGCVVTGIDFCEANIACCRFLRGETEMAITFDQKELTLEYADSLAGGQFDVILLLNVAHHIAHGKGFEYARSVVEGLAQKATLVIAELAVRQEPVYWADALPDSYDRWCDTIAFFRELCFVPTHLSDIQRPLLVCSNSHVYGCGRFVPFDTFQSKSFEGGQAVGLRYYFGPDTMIKYYRGGKEHPYYGELQREHDNLKHPLSFYPQVLCWEQSERSILGVYRIRRGTLLWDVIKKGDPVNVVNIALNVLDNLIELEQHGLYHNDIRTWNVILDYDNHAMLIDIGSISRRNVDFQSEVLFRDARAGFPLTTQRAFVSLVYDLLTKNTYPEIPVYATHMLTLFYDTNRVPSEFVYFFQAYLLAGPKADTFAEIRRIFEDTVVSKQRPRVTAADRAQLAMVYELSRFYEYQKRAELQRLDFHSANHERVVQIQSVRSICEDLTRATDSLTQSDARCAAVIEAMQQEVLEYGRNLESLVGRCTQLSESVTASKNDHQAVAERLASLSNISERHAAVIQALESANRDRIEHIQAIIIANEARDTAIQTVESANRDRIAHIASIERANQARDAAIRVLEEANISRVEQIKAMGVAYRAHDTAIQALENANHDRIAHYAAIDTANQARDAAVHALENRIGVLEVTSRKQEAETVELRTSLVELTVGVATLRDDVAQHVKYLTALQTAHAALAREVGTLTADQKDLKQVVDALRQVLSSNVRRAAMVAGFISKTTFGARRNRAKSLARLAQHLLNSEKK